MATDKKKCKARASNTGDQCKRVAVEDGLCKQHYKQIHPEATGDVITQEEAEQTITEAAGQALVSDPAFTKYELAKRVAYTLAQSNLVPEAYRGRQNDVFVAINMGSELGMEPFQAIQSIAVIEGKPCLYGDGLIGVVRASPKCLWIEESVSPDGKTATCRTQRQGDPNPVEQSYSMDDAVQAGIHTKFNWKKHPKRMLQMRARAYCLRDAYPDLLKGLGVVEEMVDHETTPPPVTQYDLPKAQGGEQPELRPAVDVEPTTLADVERAINQSDSMEQLLDASQKAKLLANENDKKTARFVYNKQRTLLLENQNG